MNTNYLLGIIAALVGAFFYQKNKANSAEARNDNLDVKEKLNTVDQDIAKNNGNLESEQQKQNELKKELQNVDVQDSIEKLVDFFKKRG